MLPSWNARTAALDPDTAEPDTPSVSFRKFPLPRRSMRATAPNDVQAKADKLVSGLRRNTVAPRFLTCVGTKMAIASRGDSASEGKEEEGDDDLARNPQSAEESLRYATQRGDYKQAEYVMSEMKATREDRRSFKTGKFSVSERRTILRKNLATIRKKEQLARQELDKIVADRERQEGLLRELEAEASAGAGADVGAGA